MLGCALGEVADGALGDVILEVGIYATEGKLLACIVACLPEGVVGEAPIAAVVVLDPNARLAVTVSIEESSTWRWTYLSRLKWSTKTVAQR